MKAAPVSDIGARRLLVDGQPLDYTLRRSQRRSIGLRVDDQGLVVTAPAWVPLEDIETALRARHDWVRRKLVEWRERAARTPSHDPCWTDGADLLHLGKRLRITASAAHHEPVRRIDDRLLVDPEPESLHQRVQDWLEAEARERLAERLAHHAGRFGRWPTYWTLSAARTRWGSCNRRGVIRLNWRLVHFPLEIIDYVVCHELAHLEHMNHGPDFWRTVAQLYPDHLRARQWLRDIPDGGEI